MQVNSVSRAAMFLKRQSEIVIAVTVLVTAAGAIIAAFGGNIPPWYTSAKAEADKRAAATIQASTVAALTKLAGRVDDLKHHDDQKDCSELAPNMEKAQAALRKNPDDPLALALAQTTRSQMREIAGCEP